MSAHAPSANFSLGGGFQPMPCDTANRNRCGSEGMRKFSELDGKNSVSAPLLEMWRRGASRAMPPRHVHCVPVSQMEIEASRIWRIVIHEHADRSFTVRVWVDGKLLLPDCVACTSTSALAYVAEALIDVRPSDELALRTQGQGRSRAFRAADAAAARQWLVERLQAEGER